MKKGSYPETPWVTDNGILFLPLTGRLLNGFWERSEESVNEILLDWGYDLEVTSDTLRKFKKSFWVDPKVILDEIWPTYACSAKRVGNWWELYRYDLEDLAYENTN